MSWNIVKLSDAIELHRRWFIPDPGKMYAEIGVRSYGKGLFHKAPVSGLDLGSKRVLRVEPGDLVFSNVFAWEGAVAVAGDAETGMIGSHRFLTFRPKANSCDVRYLQYYFRRGAGLELTRLASPGSAGRNRTLGIERFLRQSIPLPPVVEQQRMVAKIEGLAARIGDVDALRHQIRSATNALVTSLHFEASAGPTCRMSDLVVLSEDREPVQPDCEYPQVGIRGFGGGLFAKPATKGSDTTYRHFNRIRAGQLVLSQVKGWEGAIGVCPNQLEGFFASPEYRTFDCIAEKCEPRYLDVVVRSEWFAQLLAAATRGQGARRERTRPELFLQLEAAFPPIEDQRRLLRTIQRLQRVAVLHQEASPELEALLPSILDKAFKGAL